MPVAVVLDLATQVVILLGVMMLAKVAKLPRLKLIL